MNCRHCGTSIIKGDQYCAGCGQTVNKKFNFKVSKIGLVAIFLIFICGMGLYLFMQRDILSDLLSAFLIENPFQTEQLLADKNNIDNNHSEHLQKEQILLADKVINDGVPRILYHEDFDRGELVGWMNEIPFVTGNIIIYDPNINNPGWIIHDDSGNFCLKGSRSHATARRYDGWADFTVSFRIKILNLGYEYFNFTFRESLGSGYNRYFLNINDGGRPFQLIKQNTADSSKEPFDKDFKTLSFVDKRLSKNRWYTLKVSVKKDRINIYLDDQLLINYQDQNNPILYGYLSFEIGKNAEIMIDDIMVIKDFLERPADTLNDHEKTDLPTLQATVQELRFFEENDKATTRATRNYDSRFNQDSTRFIWWELHLACAPGRKADFNIKAVLIEPDGSIMCEEEISGFFIDKNWTESTHAAGFGYPTSGMWKPGIYKVQLYVEGELIAGKRFQIISDSEGTGEGDQSCPGPYIIDHEFGNMPISELPLGSRVIDPSWEWEIRTGDNYSGTGECKAVSWLLVAKNHYPDEEPHVTLLAEELIGRFAFDNSADRGHAYGSNHWGNSGISNAKQGLRPWLNSVGIHAGEGFYESFSSTFRESIVTVGLPNRDWEKNASYITKDKVFIPSTTELGCDQHEIVGTIGTTYPYFDGQNSEVRKALLAGNYIDYWSRSPSRVVSYSVLTFNTEGSLTIPDSYQLFNIGPAYRSYCGVRPAVNLKSDVIVYCGSY